MDLCSGIPLSFHNLWVILLMLLVLVWILQIAYRICRAEHLNWRMHHSGILFLDKLSIYAWELQRIIRQHFNQLLRIRPAVPARDIAQLKVLAHLHPESLRLSQIDQKISISFQVDTLQPCKLHIHWGQDCASFGCQDLDDLLESEGQSVPSGCGQAISIGLAAHLSVESILALADMTFFFLNDFSSELKCKRHVCWISIGQIISFGQECCSDVFSLEWA